MIWASLKPACRTACRSASPTWPRAATGLLVLQGLYQGAGVTIVAMMLFLMAVHELGAERTGALVALVPVLAGVAAAPLLDEPLSGWLVAGLICVSAGAFVAARPGRATPH